MKFKFLVCLALFFGGAWIGDLDSIGQGAREISAKEGISSEADLDRVIAQLQAQATRFDAFLALLDFAGYPEGNIHNEDLRTDALHDKAITAFRDCPGLDAVIANMIERLNQPGERLTMIKYLLKFSAPYSEMEMTGASSGNRTLDDSMKCANEAVNSAFDPSTVTAALTNSDWLLRITAVEHFGNPPTSVREWKPLLPQMEKLAVTDDAAIRKAADQKLQGFPGTETFLDERLTNETSAEVILELLEYRHVVGKKFNDRFLALFVPLLSSTNENVRVDALVFVGFNSQRAPMLQFTFGTNAFDAALASTRAKSVRERAAAAEALTELRQLDPIRSREAFLHMTNDPDENVRWHVAWGLSNQLDREDVKGAIAILLQDKSPTVRYMTILAAGPQKYVPELKELAKEPDSWAARSARDKLKQLAENKGN